MCSMSNYVEEGKEYEVSLALISQGRLIAFNFKLKWILGLVIIVSEKSRRRFKFKFKSGLGLVACYSRVNRNMQLSQAPETEFMRLGLFNPQELS